MAILENHGVAHTTATQAPTPRLVADTSNLRRYRGRRSHLSSTYSTVCFTAASAACFACHESWKKDLATGAPIIGLLRLSQANHQ